MRVFEYTHIKQVIGTTNVLDDDDDDYKRLKL